MIEIRQEQLLAIHVRNHMGATGSIFTPFDGLHLTYDQDGTLCCVTPGTSYGEGQYQMPLIHRSELMDATDEEIWGAVMEGRPIVRESEPEPEATTVKRSTITTRKTKR